MKKSIILFVVFCVAYGASLLALGIYMAQYSLAEMLANKLVEIASIVGLILVILFYIPIRIMGFMCYILMFFGAAYILITARVLLALRKNNLKWLYKNLRILNFSHCCLLILIFLADCVIFPYIFINIQNGVSVPLVIFTLLINATAIALEITNIFAVKKLKQMLLNAQGPSV